MNNNKAIFLVEVTLTVAILSIGLVFIIRSINSSMRVAGATSNYSQAIDFAYKKAFELELSSALQNLNSTFDLEKEGTFPNNNNFSWKYLIEEVKNYNLKKVIIDIIWKQGKREGSLDVVTYVSAKEETE